MPKKTSGKTAPTAEKLVLPRDLQLKWTDAAIDMKKAQVASATATKKVDEFALAMEKRKYSSRGTQTKGVVAIRTKDVPERLRNVEAAELMRLLKVMSDLQDVYGEVASGDFGSTIRRELKEAKREKKADAEIAPKEEEEKQKAEDLVEVGTTGDDKSEVPTLKHEDHNRDEHRSRHDDRAASEDRRSLPRAGRTPPRLPRRRSPSKSPERNPQWKADLITARIQQARRAPRSPSREAREDGKATRSPRREDRSRSRSSAPGEQRHAGSPVPDTQRRRHPTPAVEEGRHRRHTPNPEGLRRQPRSPIPEEKRRRHPPPSSDDGNALEDAKAKDEQPRADEDALRESGDDEAPPKLEKCAEMEEAKLEEGEVCDEGKETMSVAAPSKKQAENNPLEAGRTHRKRTAPEKPRAPKKKKAKSAEEVEDSSDSDAETEENKRKDKRKKVEPTEATKTKTVEEKKDEEEKKNESGEEEKDDKDEPKDVPGIIGPRTPSGSPRRSTSRSRSPPKKKSSEEPEEAESDASSSSSASSSSESSSSSSGGSESEGEEGEK